MPLPTRDTDLIQIMDAAFADAAKRAGGFLACRAGCTQCCHGAFAVNSLDAERLRTGMAALQAADPVAAEAVTTRAKSWIAEFGAEFPGDVETGLLGTTEEEEERFEEFANDAACPALDPATGLCAVYDWRPMTCRLFGPPVRVEADDATALAYCELCFHGATADQVAACEMQVPHALEEELIKALPATGDTVVAFALIS